MGYLFKFLIVLIAIIQIQSAFSQRQEAMDENDESEDNRLSSKNITITTSTQFPVENSTTPAPKPITMTTTRVPIPTTTSPTPIKPPKPFPNNIGNWSVFYNQSNISCVLLHGAFQLRLSNLTIDVPSDAIGNGKCDNRSDTLNITWNDVNGIHFNFHIKFGYDLLDLGHYYVDMFKLEVSSSPTSSNSNELLNNGPYFKTSFNKSYLCNSKESFVDETLHLEISNLQFQAFREKDSKNNEFSIAEVCSNDISSFGTMIGVIIGSILAALIGIAIGAYFAFRYNLFSKCNNLCPCCRRSGGYERLDI